MTHEPPSREELLALQEQPTQMTLRAFLRLVENMECVTGAFDRCCGDDGCTDDDPRCYERKVDLAMRQAWKVFDYVIRSLSPERLNSVAEFVFVDEWRKQNIRHNHINSGWRTLEGLLGVNDPAIKPDTMWGPGQRQFPMVTQDQADASTAFVQWLGTNCGRCFLDECEQRIAKLNASKDATSKFRRYRFNVADAEMQNEDLIRLEAERIGINFDPEGKARSCDGMMASLIDVVEAAIRRFANDSNDQPVICHECGAKAESRDVVTLRAAGWEGFSPPMKGNRIVCCPECLAKGGD